MVGLNFVSYDDDTKIKILSEKNCHCLLPLEGWNENVFFIQKVRKLFSVFLNQKQQTTVKRPKRGRVNRLW